MGLAATILLLPILQTGAIAAIDSNPCFTGVQQTASITSIDNRRRTFKIKGSRQNFALAGLEISTPTDALKVGTDISIFASQEAKDRYGIVSVQAFLKTPQNWIQGDMLQKGTALLNGSSKSLSRKCLATMQNAELAAINTKAGLWAQKDAIFKAGQLDQLSEKTGFFTVIEGRVISVGNRKKRLYLNFGQNWSQDFTLSVVKKGKGAFKGSLDLLAGLKGKTIRVRGVLEQRQGPLIRLFDEAQIELIEN